MGRSETVKHTIGETSNSIGELKQSRVLEIIRQFPDGATLDDIRRGIHTLGNPGILIEQDLIPTIQSLIALGLVCCDKRNKYHTIP